MTQEQLDITFTRRFNAIFKTLIEKGKKYTEGNKDRLHNFKSLSKVIGVTPLQVWEVFFRKHWAAIKYFLKTGNDIGEDVIDNNIHDCIVYLFLLEALIKDAKNEECIVRASSTLPGTKE